MKGGKNGFTLVELIVVITILSVLGTIAFISFQWYALSARDSARLSDIRSIISSIEFYKTEHDAYPTPSSNFNITYSWGLLWTQWTFWEETRSLTKKISNVPLDPLTGSEYAYSITNNKQEYMVGWIQEWIITQNNSLLIHANNKRAKAYTRGNYNKKFIKTTFSSGSVDYDAIVAVPSILSSEVWPADINVIDLINNNSFVINDLYNAPASYIDSGYSGSGRVIYTPANPVIFIGQIIELGDPTTRLDVIDKLQTAYSGATFAGLPIYQEIAIVDTSSIGIAGSPSTGLQLITNYLATNQAGIEVDGIDGSDYSDIDTSPNGACSNNPTDESYFTFSAGTKTITAYSDSGPKDVIIPCQIWGVDVEVFGTRAFQNKQLTSVYIPNSLKTIWFGAFQGNLLTSLVIPSSVTTIRPFAFTFNQLSSVSIPNSVTTIWNTAFNTNQLTNIVIPNSITHIESSTFGTNQLTSVTLPNTITHIGDWAFSSNQLISIIIPSSVTHIWNAAFSNNQLTSIVIPDLVSSLWNAAFNTNQLTSITLPNSITSIWSYTFNSNQLTNISIPNTVTSIDNYAFSDNQLTSLNLPSSITTIWNNAFDSNQLTNLTLPSWVNTIEDNAFQHNNLTASNIITQCSLPTFGYNVFRYNGPTNILHVPNPISCTP